MKIAFTIVLLSFSFISFCQHANLEFIENKGQWDERVKFKGVINNGAFFLEEKGFSVLLNNPADLKKLADRFHGNSHDQDSGKKAAKPGVPPKNEITVHSHAYALRFVNAGSAVIVPDKPLNTYNNYFIGNNPLKWKGNCSIYQGITYKNMYPGIDVRYYTNEGRLKYDIVVHPGADISRLVMRYDGVDALSVKNEELVIKTSVGEVRELAPYAFQVVNGQKKEVACRFKVAGKMVQFAIGTYAASSPLVIDPTLIFSTFTGSPADNWGYTATFGVDGSFYSGGIVFDAGFPTSTGAFQTSYNGGDDAEAVGGGYDIGIMKFSANGTQRVYATYIGGSKNEHPHSLVADAQGNLVIGGRTSSENYPVKGANVGTGGKYDIILTKINATGSDLIGSRKIGGTDDDGVNIGAKYGPTGVLPAESLRRNYGDDARSEVILDEAGNVLLASNTRSNNFPVTPGAFQSTFGGKQDGVLIKASADLSNILFSSYIGGADDDAAFVLAMNPNDPTSIYIGGNTVSSDLLGEKTGVINAAFQGGLTDGFVSIISADGSTLRKTCYLGTSGNDMLYGIQFDRFGFPYIMGTTTGNWPVRNAAFSQAGGKQFIAKLQPDLSDYVFSTVFGPNTPDPNISPTAFLVDKCENVYVSGWGGLVNTGSGYPNSTTTNLSTTPDAIQPTTDGSDFYFFVLERNAARQLYGSFFGQNGGGDSGGEHVDGGTSRFDRNGVIYQAMCANCGRGAVFPTTPGVWSTTNGSENCNLAAVKIAFNLAGITGSVRSSIKGVVQDTVGCVPLTVDFTDTIAGGQRYIWNFGDGTADETTTEPSLSHTYNSIGSYRVRLISIDESKCNVADTAYTTIRVRTFEAVPDFLTRKLPPCETFNYEFTNTSTVNPAARPFTDTSFTWDFGDNTPPVIAGMSPVTHAFPGPGEYRIRLQLTDTNFCNAPVDTTRLLKIATNVTARFETTANGCAPYTAVFTDRSAGGQQFYWDFGDNTSSTESSPSHVYAIPGVYRVTLRVVDSATCNIFDTTSLTITVNSLPVASFNFTPNPPRDNTPVDFFNSSMGAIRYLWKFGDGDSLAISSREPVRHSYNTTDTFSACLIAITDFGCQDTVCQDIQIRVTPLVDVPNAFTPNGDGVNDKIYVRGYGIAKMNWKIYNRWGALVYETHDRLQGWDGNHQGTKQASEVYHYVLDVEYADNSKYQKKGDITLLR